MSNFTIEITAPTIVAAIEKLISSLAPKQIAVPGPLPQSFPQMAAQQSIAPVPAPQPAPTYTPPAASVPQQPQYQAPPQQYKPAVPINPMPTAPIQTPAVPPMNNANAAPQQTAPIQQAPVAAAPSYQIDDLARAAAQLMDAGKQQELLSLLAQFGVQTLGLLPPDKFGAFATALRQMGARV